MPVETTPVLHAVARIHEAMERVPGQSVYLLVDPITWPEEEHARWSGRPVEWTAVPVRHPDVEPDQTPRLLRLALGTASVDDRLLKESVSLSLEEVQRPAEAGRKARSYCAWIVSGVSIQALANAIARTCWQHIEGRRRLVRIWDPRLLSSWADVCCQEEMALDAAPSEWFFFDWSGDLIRLHASGNRGHAMAWHEQRLLQLGAFNRLIQLFVRHQETPGRALGTEVWRALALVGQLNLPHEDDRFRVARDCLLHGDAIRHSSRFAEILTTARQHPGSYGVLASEMDSADWREMVREGASALRSPNP